MMFDFIKVSFVEFLLFSNFYFNVIWGQRYCKGIYFHVIIFTIFMLERKEQNIASTKLIFNTINCFSVLKPGSLILTNFFTWKNLRTLICLQHCVMCWCAAFYLSNFWKIQRFKLVDCCGFMNVMCFNRVP